ncbi:hypothetical protein ACSLV1_30790 [Pseudomonas aeruginosa]|uniref:Uncharacterized protein n=3 Tax=Pseudomonas aeruginosa group TaxID=136841 RepID=A6V5S1_PSEP7|nr:MULTISPECIES: hypothetical protein [Pseudomonas aeruginosa group]ABR82055.1 hypothetical protein PSPA7_3046 [Pseudomonas aeruginosa PA7]KSC92729.1 hypothetical protein AO896_06435 [Pseudomonas aeruginosa]KSD26343.1 hypothetical protein AO898_06280 [Pseudomonas aeruginosa]KSG58393.1 hypothetical protein AO955_07035 [Pseudomonas aeruginosa]MCW8362995.1 hypothetical protein [Pseudomonas aeruginosa]
MDNPFKKRATEYVADPSTLLPLVSHTPIQEFFSPDGGELLEKLSIVVGTPGCGKTTIARVIEFESLATLARDPVEINKELATTLTHLRILEDSTPSLLAYRLPMTTNFRSIWDLPYPESLRATLLRAYVQSKAVLGWFRQLESIESIDLEQIEIITRSDSESAREVLRADTPSAFREKARQVELAVFKVITALVAPSERDLAEVINTKYDVFEYIERIRVKNWVSSSNLVYAELRPMAIVDDAHELHPLQFAQLRDWLKSRNIRVGRWVMCRPDVVSPEDYREAMAKDVLEEEQRHGTARGRDYILKLMQPSHRNTRRFQVVARDISARYLHGITELSRRSVRSLGGVLDHDHVVLAPAQLEQLRNSVETFARESKLSDAVLHSLRSRIPATLPTDEATAAFRILLRREWNRSPQLGLLDDDPAEEPVTGDRPVSSALLEGARLQLFHEFGRPYYFGMDKLAEASNNNIEQFIRLSGVLIDELIARVVRGKTPELSAKLQHDVLRKLAARIMEEWDFPYHALVKDVISGMAQRCLERTLLPNAPLDHGANAIGIPQEEMDQVLARSERLTRVLHYAFAYKALVFVPQYRCKGRVWCLLELGAIPSIAYGLTLRRGGFIEDTLSGLQSLLKE